MVKRGWVVVGVNHDQKFQVFGNFKYEDTAEEWAKRMSNKLPHLIFIPAPVTPRGELEDYAMGSGGGGSQ